MNEEIKNLQFAVKVKKYVESKVVIEPRYTPHFFYLKDEAERVAAELKFYRNWANEIKEFFRDHRHQDVNQVYVDISEIDACSKCGDSWEPYLEETGETICASCGALVKPKQDN